MDKVKFSERGKQILRLVIDHYIKTEEPVGSYALVESYDLPWSPATVRGTMAELMDQGYLTQPHLSAGRVPTEKGIRFYVDFLLYPRRLSQEKRVLIRKRYEQTEGTLDEVIQETSRMLSDISHCTGLATLPSARFMKIKSAELVKLGDKKVLVVIVFEGGMMEKTLIRIEREISKDALQRMSRYLSELAVGLTLDEVKALVVSDLKFDKRLYDELIQSVIRFSRRIFEQRIQSNIYIKGQTSILENSERTSPERLRELFRAFEEKSFLVNILDKAMKKEGTGVFVGSENGITEGYSLVAAPYGSGKKLGTLGVLGPIRMDYSRIISLVDYTARFVSKIVSEGEQ
ncbi:MAG: heat-inducible transcription repressor HrcA [Candidatus Dadabacteria bacterium]